MLMEIANLWNEFLISSVILYVIALILVGLTFLATHTKHLITGAVVALTAGLFGQASKLVFKVGAFLALLRLVLNFI